MTRTRAADRPSIRLLWDEDVSVRVAKALRELGLRVTWIGSSDAGTPAKGSGDAEVIEFALRTNQVIVTKNHDMMMLCHEAGQRFVWMDPYGRKHEREEQVVIVFSQVREWQQILHRDDQLCVRSLRGGARPITSEEAARLANQRFKAIERKKRTRRRTPPVGPKLPTDDS